mmetsp:Transcript_142199/g.250885  ORF Transcript_142199/g.250885 Transcript_142199/m.250885 type:complete len:416 (-) Transcript_142199:89-1336(-)
MCKMLCFMQHPNLMRLVNRRLCTLRHAVPGKYAGWRGCRGIAAVGEGAHDPPAVRRERARKIILQQAADESVREPQVEDLDYDGRTSESNHVIAVQRKERRVQGLRRQAEALAEPCRIIDGKRIAAEVRAEVKYRVASLRAKDLPEPGLAVVMVGSRKDSASYVKSKESACHEVGIVPKTINMPEDSTEEQLLATIDELNVDPSVHGILVQLPLPKHFNPDRVIRHISFQKDVDGFHPHNLGLIAQGSKDAMVPCTPKGCMEILKRRGVDLQGKFCAVIGASNIVGLPMALLLLRANATVEILHAHTGTSGFGMGIGQTANLADVLIVCCGQPQMVTTRFLKPGGVVIDVGINVITDSSRKSGKRMVGDVNLDDCLSLSSQVTPVPGGVGPMTVAMLMENVLIAYDRLVHVRHDW